MDRTPPTAADIKSLASDVARLRAKANEAFRVLATDAAEILFALDAMSERLANVPAVAPEDAFDVAIHGAETVRATDGTLPDNLGASPRVVVVSDGTRYAPARRVCGAVFDAGGYPQGCTLDVGHEHPDDHDATPGPCAKTLGTVTIVDSSGNIVSMDGGAEGSIVAGPDGLKVSA